MLVLRQFVWLKHGTNLLVADSITFRWLIKALFCALSCLSFSFFFVFIQLNGYYGVVWCSSSTDLNLNIQKHTLTQLSVSIDAIDLHIRWKSAETQLVFCVHYFIFIAFNDVCCVLEHTGNRYTYKLIRVPAIWIGRITVMLWTDLSHRVCRRQRHRRCCCYCWCRRCCGCSWCCRFCRAASTSTDLFCPLHRSPSHMSWLLLLLPLLSFLILSFCALYAISFPTPFRP